MKHNSLKRVLSLIMAISMVLGCGVTVSAEETSTDEHVHCVCGGTQPAGHSCDETQVWTAWGDDDSETTLPKTAGYYYLTRDFDRAWTDTVSADVYLCLNGYTVTSSSGAGYRLLNVGVEGGAAGSVTLCDCQGTGVIKDKTDVNHSIAGRLIAIHAKGVFTMYGGTIEGGEVQTTTKNVGGWGGNIYNNGVFNMYGGCVTGGTALANASGVRGQGGNIYISATGVMNMYGGCVTGGSAVAGGNIYNSGTLNLNGVVNITGATAGGNVYVPTGKSVNATNLQTGSVAGVTVEDTSAAFATVATEGQKSLFVSDVAGTSIVYENGGLLLKSGHVHCVCGGTKPVGHTCEDVDFQPWDGKAVAGNFYVAEDMDISDVTVNGELVLCLNGCTVTSSGRALVSGTASNVATVTDCVGGGVIQSANNSKNGGLMFFMNGTLNLYGGTVQKIHEEAGANGMVVKLGNNATSGGIFNMYGGTVQNGNITGKGGNIYAIGTSIVNIQGGTVANGQASGDGDNIYIGSSKANTVANATLIGTEGGDNLVMDGASALKVENCAISGGTGIKAMSGATTVTGAMDMTCTTDIYVDNVDELVITVMELTDKDGTVTVDATAKPGTFAATDADYTTLFASTDDCFGVAGDEGQLTLERTKWAAAYAGNQLIGNFATFAEAVAAAENGYVKLLDDLNEETTVTGEAWVDLNGKSLSGITVEGTLYGMDTTTDGYDGTNAGTLTATVSGEGQIAVHNKTTAQRTGAIKRYLAVADENGVYSFHRFYMGITHINLKPGTTGIGYKASFYGDEQVIAQLAETETFGYTLQLEGNGEKSYFIDKEFVASGMTLTLRVDNFDVANYGETALTGKVFVKFGDTVVESSTYSYSMRQMVEAAAATIDSYTAEQITALQDMCNANSQAMEGWNIDSILNWTAPTE